MLSFLNILFTVVHIALTLFNLTGWLWPKTRKLHLITLSLTILSWFLLGIWHGWGYCPLTDWHWDVKQQLGETNLPNSFIKYYADKITGQDIAANLIDKITVGGLIFAIAGAMLVNFILPKKRLRKKTIES